MLLRAYAVALVAMCRSLPREPLLNLRNPLPKSGNPLPTSLLTTPLVPR
jgi:hypothetical protein